MGTAAGGGLPQWNCACANCQDARQGRTPSRLQSSVVIGDDSGSCFLVNASPDLPAQIEATPALQPDSRPFRNSPISAVLLTNADLDHVLGLFSLREGARLQIHATPAVRQTLARSLGLAAILDEFCGATWHEPSVSRFVPLFVKDGVPSSLSYRAIALPGLPPRFLKGDLVDGIHSVAYQIKDQRTGRCLLVAPDVCSFNDGLREALATSDAVLFDGTFWSEDELTRVKPGAARAGAMGHVTIRDTSLEVLRELPANPKVYIHINNTNPVLAPGAPERAAVEAAGILVGYDGLEFEI